VPHRPPPRGQGCDFEPALVRHGPELLRGSMQHRGPRRSASVQLQPAAKSVFKRIQLSSRSCGDATKRASPVAGLSRRGTTGSNAQNEVSWKAVVEIRRSGAWGSWRSRCRVSRPRRRRRATMTPREPAGRGPACCCSTLRLQGQECRRRSCNRHPRRLRASDRGTARSAWRSRASTRRRNRGRVHGRPAGERERETQREGCARTGSRTAARR